jgi:hypothetical protein
MEITEFMGFTLGETVYLQSDLQKKIPMVVSGFGKKSIYDENDLFPVTPIRRELRYIECEWFNSQRKIEIRNFLPETLKK